MHANKIISVAGLLAAVVAVFVVLGTVTLPTDTFLWAEIHNFGHTPLFGILSLALLGLSLILIGKRIKLRVSHYLLAASVAFALGLITELTQIFNPRDSDFWDQVRNTAGVMGFLGIILSFDRKTAEQSPWLSGPAGGYIRWLAVLTLIASVTPTLFWGYAYYQRNNQFPDLCLFETYTESRFIVPHQASVESVPTPASWSSNQSGLAGEVTFFPEANYPGFVLADPRPDWSAYDQFVFDVFSEIDTSLTLYLSINDHDRRSNYEDRYNLTMKLYPGLNNISVSLDSVRVGPVDREIDLSSIARINIFAYQPSDTMVLFVDNLKLK